MLLLSLSIIGAGCTQDADPADGGAAQRAAEEAGPVARYCSGCHAPPRGRAHTAEEWPAVVSRMQQRRVSRGLAPIPSEDLERITEYLQQRARDGTR